MSQKDYDFIVVGSGAAGAAACWRLCQQGYRVVCLEKGTEQNPSKYPSTGSDWELKKQEQYNPVMSERQIESDYPIDESDSPISVCNYNAVGGSTIIYSGHFPRFQPRDFQLKTKDGLHQDWPIKYSDLEPYFELNEQQMSVSGLVGDPYYPQINSLLPPVPLGKTGELIGEAFNALGWHWWPSYSAIATKAYGGRDACINLGPCNTGCPQGAKSSVDVTYLAQAKKLGLELRTNASVDSVITDKGIAKGVLYFDESGKQHKVFANNVILAASAIGTPRVLLNSKDASTDLAIANSSGLIGKNLMIHPLGYVEGIFDHELDTDIGPQGCMLFSLEHFRPKDVDFDLGYMMHVLRGTGPLETAKSALAKRKLKFGHSLEQSFYQYFKKQLSISIICDDLPISSNRVELSEQKDKFGTPGVKIYYQVSGNTMSMMKHGMTNAKAILKQAGATKTYAYGPVKNTGWHIMGTCKMGEDPNNSVVNPEGKSHDVDNLFVVDSSCFVSGSCVNPANTIQAVSLYLTDKIMENYGKRTH